MRIAQGSLRWAFVPLVLAGVVAPFAPRASVALGGAGLGVLFFHRDPERTPRGSGVVAPADGTVSVLRAEDDRVRLGIYMRGRDVHVNRAPMTGVVEEIEHEPGTNKLAFRKEAEANERLRFCFEEYIVEQIAGAFARRTHSYVDPGQPVRRGERIGHISFSSRCDLLFPPGYDLDDLTVEVGDRVLAGATVVARSRSASAGSSIRETQDGEPTADRERLDTNPDG